VSSDVQPPPPGAPRPRPGVATGLLTGLITAAVALGVGQLVAGLTGSAGSPVIAVGSATIDFTPPPVKDFAISTFGSHDKTALVSGILVLLAVFAALIGVAAVRRFRYGVVGLAIFTAIGLIAALTRPTATPADALPSLAGGAAGLLTLALLVRAAHEGAAARAAAAAAPLPAPRRSQAAKRRTPARPGSPVGPPSPASLRCRPAARTGHRRPAPRCPSPAGGAS